MTFDEYFTSVHGVAPFPWQREAARRLVADEPFDVLAVPTAAGKTAVLDAAIYAAAHGGRRRIAFVVDRRLVVDEVVERAHHIRARLSTADDPALRAFADRLGPMQVVRLRGGVHGDDNWVLQQEAISVIVSTVDQVGSRLLFRGYGVSPRMAPVHAGFLGNDTLLVLDEAHLSQPFVETVSAIAGHGADVRLLVMSATPAGTPRAPLRLGDDDHANPLLAQRIHAKKLAKLVEGPSSATGFAAECVMAARTLGEAATVVGVVVNRVATARAIHQVLAKEADAILLIGRSRPLDRDTTLATWLPRIRAGRDRAADTPVFVVATQTIEVGANIDVDALVTESAPLSSLRQRFGRLDRLGEQGTTQAIIVHRGAKGEDPVYGDDIAKAWAWLNEVKDAEAIDFGIATLDALVQASPPPAEAQAHAATLLPSHVQALQQTGPLAPDIDVSAFLHGPGKPSREVSVIWRGDLDVGRPEDWCETIRAYPPQAREVLELPLATLRRWLGGQQADDASDLPFETGVEDRPAENRVLRWRGPEQVDLVRLAELRSGDTVVLPSSLGGCDAFGWNPNESAPVPDLAEACALERKRGFALRIAAGVVGWAGRYERPLLAAATALRGLLVPANPDDEIDGDELAQAELTLREEVAHAGGAFVEALGSGYTIEAFPAGLVLRRNRLEDVDGFLTAGKAVTLDDHQAGVARWGERLAPVGARDLVRDAGAVHDEGKREARFQAMLYGNPFAAAAGPALAKSGLRTRGQVQAAYVASGLPRGFRHELASLTYIQSADPLLRHLVATHHGFGRPWYPRCDDAGAAGHEATAVGSGWTKAFFDLSGSVGPWKLAGLESALRAADARRSIEEQQDD